MEEEIEDIFFKWGLDECLELIEDELDLYDQQRLKDRLLKYIMDGDRTTVRDQLSN